MVNWQVVTFAIIVFSSIVADTSFSCVHFCTEYAVFFLGQPHPDSHFILLGPHQKDYIISLHHTPKHMQIIRIVDVAIL